MQVGLVGKPAAGKSTFFKALTLLDVKITGIPFCTIKPNVGVGFVSLDCVCEEFGVRCNPSSGKCVQGKRFVPVKLIDVAGLVPGAHLGKGLGNKFLDDLRKADVLIHIVDFSGLRDEEGKPTQNYDPEKDIKFLEEEIDFWFASLVEKALEKIKVKKEEELIDLLTQKLSGLQVERAQIEKALREVGLEDVKKFATALRKNSKPMVIAANKIDLEEAQQNFERLKGKYELVPVSAEAEVTLKKAHEKNFIEYLPGNGFKVKKELNEEQKKALEFLQALIKRYGSTGVQQCLNQAVFEKLGMIAVFPVADANKLTDSKGNVLPDVLLVQRGTKLRELAYKIHSALGEKFIAGVDARSKKKLGADYELQNRDVVEIRAGR